MNDIEITNEPPPPPRRGTECRASAEVHIVEEKSGEVVTILDASRWYNNDAKLRQERKY
jgi:hypothetical protein